MSVSRTWSRLMRGNQAYGPIELKYTSTGIMKPRHKRFYALLALLVACSVSGQSLVDEFGDVFPSPPPPALKISEVVKEQTFEHHLAARLRASPPPIAPAPGPSAGAPAPGLISVYDLLPPEERKVVGVASAVTPGAVAAGPEPLHSNLTVAGGTFTQVDRPLPTNASAPSDILWNVSADDNAMQLKAEQTFAPPAPVAFVSADGSLIFVGPSSPTGYVGNSTTPATHWLWPTVALLGLIGIVASIGWAYSKRRQRRYLDLKDTEMAMQNRPHNPV